MTIRTSDQNVILVAIVGGSGAGKSALAQTLCMEFGSVAERVSLDHFYRDLSHLPVARRDRINFDNPRQIDWAAVEEALRRMRHGHGLELPAYDFATHCRLPVARPWTPRPLVFWEGLWLLHRRNVRMHFSYSIYIECAAEERLSRRIRRDIAERGRTVESVRDQFKQHVEPMHQLYVAPQKQHATSCVTSPIRGDEFKALVVALRDLLQSSPQH